MAPGRKPLDNSPLVPTLPRVLIDFDAFEAVLLDLDGTIYHEEHALPGAELKAFHFTQAQVEEIAGGLQRERAAFERENADRLFLDLAAVQRRVKTGARRPLSVYSPSHLSRRNAGTDGLAF